MRAKTKTTVNIFTTMLMPAVLKVQYAQLRADGGQGAAGRRGDAGVRSGARQAAGEVGGPGTADADRPVHGEGLRHVVQGGEGACGAERSPAAGHAVAAGAAVCVEDGEVRLVVAETPGPKGPG